MCVCVCVCVCMRTRAHICAFVMKHIHQCIVHIGSIRRRITRLFKVRLMLVPLPVSCLSKTLCFRMLYEYSTFAGWSYGRILWLSVDIRTMAAFHLNLTLLLLLPPLYSRNLKRKELRDPLHLFGDWDWEGTGQTLDLMLAQREKVVVEEVQTNMFFKTVKLSFSFSM